MSAARPASPERHGDESHRMCSVLPPLSAHQDPGVGRGGHRQGTVLKGLLPAGCHWKIREKRSDDHSTNAVPLLPAFGEASKGNPEL